MNRLQVFLLALVALVAAGHARYVQSTTTLRSNYRSVYVSVSYVRDAEILFVLFCIKDMRFVHVSCVCVCAMSNE